KTQITHISEGFDFLGQNLRKYANGKLIIKPSKKNIKAFLDDIRITIKNNKQIPAGQLVVMLNRKIRGWTNYHRHVASKQTFAKIDHEMFDALWKWAKRRHPNKGKRWIKQRYFTTVAGNNWIFFGEHLGSIRTLYQASSTWIKRHTKIRGEANPYDPEWEIYFEKRLTVKMRGNLRGRKQLLQLWNEQNGRCPICKQPITELSGWHNHHIVWRVRGGTDSIENRVLLHPTCHRQVHNQGLYVEKPRPKTGR
ncbi:MAG: group II intron maturase-specific domain-containing protein, partial [Chloroflexota bacterium]